MATRAKPRKRRKKKLGWFARCVRNVEEAGRARDPAAVCGALLKKKRAADGKFAK